MNLNLYINKDSIKICLALRSGVTEEDKGIGGQGDGDFSSFLLSPCPQVSPSPSPLLSASKGPLLDHPEL